MEPAFQTISQRQFVFDTPAQASLAKLCGNALIAATIEGLGEVFAVAEKGGIANQRLLDMLTGTLFGWVARRQHCATSVANPSARCPVVNRYGSIIINREFEPAGFAMDLGLKYDSKMRARVCVCSKCLRLTMLAQRDVRLLLAAGDQLGCPLPLGSLLRDRFIASLQQCPEGRMLDWSAIALAIRRDAGLDKTK